MKRYWPYRGVVGLAAALGLYAYVNHDPLYEEPETEEFLEEDTPEYESQLPADEITIPHAPKIKKEKNQLKNKQNPQKYNQKETTPRNQTYHPQFPKSLNLEDIIEEREKPWYDLPPEEMSPEELLDYYNTALNEEDFKVALEYMLELKKHYYGSNFQERKYKVEGLDCGIVFSYDKYLSNVVENCKKYGFDSVFNKVNFMNVFFLSNYEHFENCNTKKKKDYVYPKPNELVEKGTKALEYCQ